MRIFAVSDLHTDFAENRALLERLPRGEHVRDVLVLAGDIADRLEVVEWTLRLLRGRFARVFYTPGNHELWSRDGECDSVEKFQRVVELCARLGVETAPGREAGVWVVPLFSWYEAGGGDAGAPEGLEAWADFYFCRWPEDARPPSDFFLALNEPRVREYDGPVVSLSHFLPRADLLPPAEHLRFKRLAEVAVCAPLDAQIRRLGSAVHVFGHSHINRDLEIEGVRYVQHALRYPRERDRRAEVFKLVWDEERAGACAKAGARAT